MHALYPPDHRDRPRIPNDTVHLGRQPRREGDREPSALILEDEEPHAMRCRRPLRGDGPSGHTHDPPLGNARELRNGAHPRSVQLAAEQPHRMRSRGEAQQLIGQRNQLLACER